MGEIDRQYLETPFYGSRRMRAWLERQGMPGSRKRVQRLMRAMGLWAIYQRPSTSRHLDSIERFLTDTSDWAMPSIILAVAPGAISETRNTIEVSPDQLQVLDGQHRIQAFYNVIHGWEMDAPRDESNGIQEKLDQISKGMNAVLDPASENRELSIPVCEQDLELAQAVRTWPSTLHSAWKSPPAPWCLSGRHLF